MLLSVVSTVSFVQLPRNTTGQLSLTDNVKIEESGLIDGSLKLRSANLACGPLNLLIMTEFSFASSCIEYLSCRISMTARNGSRICLLELVRVGLLWVLPKFSVFMVPFFTKSAQLSRNWLIFKRASGFRKFSSYSSMCLVELDSRGGVDLMTRLLR